ncbi:MAG: hypothetical protein Fur003_4140 [Candidatus Dojkabacteria bacterium]
MKKSQKNGLLTFGLVGAFALVACQAKGFQPSPDERAEYANIIRRQDNETLLRKYTAEDSPWDEIATGIDGVRVFVPKEIFQLASGQITRLNGEVAQTYDGCSQYEIGVIDMFGYFNDPSNIFALHVVRDIDLANNMNNFGPGAIPLVQGENYINALTFDGCKFVYFAPNADGGESPGGNMYIIEP